MEARHVPSPLVPRLFAALLLLGTAGGLPTLAAADEPAAGPAASTDLPEARPAEVGVDPQKLTQLSEWIREQKLDVRSFLVVKDDKLVFERYGDGLDRAYNYELYSVTKTVTSLVFGILAGEGKIGPDDKIATWIVKAHPEFKDALEDKQDLELRHLLSMSSGLYYKQVEGTDPLYYSAPEPAAGRPDDGRQGAAGHASSSTPTPTPSSSGRRSAPRRASPRTSSPRSGSSSLSACRTTTGPAPTRRARSRAAGGCGCAPSTWRSSAS